MSEKSKVSQQNKQNQDTCRSPENLPEHQYSRDELITLSKSPASVRRPKCLEQAFDSENGKWDPERWYKAKFGLARVDSPLPSGDGREQRKSADRNKDVKKRHSVNDPVEHLKEEKDGIVLCPQRRSFGTGCHVQATTLPYTRHLSLPDREESRTDRDRDREKDWDRDREKDSRERQVRKIGSGRIQIDRENNRSYSNRENFDDRDHSRDYDQDHSRDYDRDRDFARSREREHNWDRERDRDHLDSDRDRRFDRSDCFRRTGDRHFSEKHWRDREYYERGNDRNARRRNHRGEEREPEWFTGGPTSQTDTIELRGFEREEDKEEAEGRQLGPKLENKTRVSSSEDKSKSPDGTPDAGISLSGHSSPEDQQMLQSEQYHVPSHKQLEENATNIPQQNARASPNNIFDFEEILNAILPLDENGIRHGSRFSRFFSGSSGSFLGSDASSLEDILMPCDDGYSSHVVPSPTTMIGPMGALHQFQAQQGEHTKLHTYSVPHHLMCVPNSAGDNATIGKSSLPPAVTAFFNSAAFGSSGARKLNPHLDCSVETQESSVFTNSVLSSNSFSTQDAEAQLKAMLFGGSRESVSSSGAASPANLPPGVQHKAKTVAELEANMHQNSPQKRNSPLLLAAGINSSVNPRDVTAFNKLLIMINAASEASQRTQNQHEMQTAHVGYGMIPSHNEFNNAVLRNKEKQMQLLQQSLNIAQGPVQPSQEIHPQQLQHVLQSHVPPPLSHDHQPAPLNHQQAAYQQFQKQHQMALNNHKHLTDLIINPPNTPGLPQAVSTPNSLVKLRTHNGSSLVTTDPIFSLIQQNPAIVMNPASPGPHMTAMLAPQQSTVSTTTRVPSPLMFNQQPPLHLRTPSPVHPGQLSPRPLTLGTNLTPVSAMSSPTGSRSPVLHRVLSPQELSAHAQAVMQSALIKKQLQDQNERYMKKQQERTKSPNQPQINVVKPLPAAQPVLPPTPQPKGASMDTFTPTSVLRKMHSEKILEKQITESKPDKEIEFMPSMHDQTTLSYSKIEDQSQEDVAGKSDNNLVKDQSDMDPNLAAMTNQLGDQLRHNQASVLPSSLSQPMSVEEKMKLLALAEKPGYLSQMLDQSAKLAADTAARNQGRPIIRAEGTPGEERKLQQNLPANQQQPYTTLNHQQNLLNQSPNPQNHVLDPLNPPPKSPNSPFSLPNQSSRPVTGCGTAVSPSYSTIEQAGMTQYSSAQQNSVNKLAIGRAIVGNCSIQQQLHVPMAPPDQNVDMLRLMEQHQYQQYLQRLHQGPHCQGMVLPPPPVGTPIACLGPPPVAARIPLIGHPSNSHASTTLMQQQFARANAINAQHNQFSHLMAMQHSNQQPLRMAPLHPVMAGVSVHLSPRSQTIDSLSPAALSATIQRIASPHGAIKIKGPFQPAPLVNGGGPNIDVTSGIQRWFSPDILKNQLPSMPPLPTQGSQVVTVDELERN